MVFLGCINCRRLASCAFLPWMWTTLWPSRSLTTFTVARSPYWMGKEWRCDHKHVGWFALQWPELTSSRLKRATNVMFGGKQVVVCGYGEVGLTRFLKWPPNLSAAQPACFCCLSPHRLAKAAVLLWKGWAPSFMWQKWILFAPFRPGMKKM